MSDELKGQLLLIMGELYDSAYHEGFSDCDYTETSEERTEHLWIAAHKVLTLVNRAKEG